MINSKQIIKVDIQNGKVVKQSEPLLMKIEYEKHHEAYNLSIKSNLFKVPKIYDYDSKAGIIVIEYLPNILRYDSIKNPSDKIIIQIADSLSFIHDNLKIKSQNSSNLLDKYGSKNKVFIHGDFNGHNVCVDQQNNKIVILDWQTTKIFGETTTYASRFFDVLWFATYSLRKPKKKDLNFFRTIRASKLFLESYINSTKYKVNNLDFYEYANFLLLHNKNNIENGKFKEKLYYKYVDFLNAIFLKSLKKIKVNKDNEL